MHKPRLALLIPALLALAACAQDASAPTPLPVALPPIVPHLVDLDQTLLVGRWDCHELGKPAGRAAPRRVIRTFAADGQFQLLEAQPSQDILARGEWSLEGPHLVVSELALVGRGAAAAVRPTSAEVVMLTSKALLIRGSRSEDGPMVGCGRVEG